MYCVTILSMNKKRDRSDEGQVYISKAHKARLKLIANAERRTMRAELENWIDSKYKYSTLSK